jgi:hypothetical protein
MTGTGFSPRVHAIGPAEEAKEVSLFAPDKAENVASTEFFGFHPGVSFDTPTEIFAAPGAEAVAAGGIPDESQRREQGVGSWG